MRRLACGWSIGVLITILLAGCERSAERGSDGKTDAFLRDVLQTAQKSHGFPAAAAALMTSRDVHVVALGKRRIDRPDSVTLDDRFGLGSNTKAFTATMLGALVERGILRWQMTCAEALPNLAMRPEYRPVTLREILTHRAGFAPWTTDAAFERARSFYKGDLVAARIAFAETVLSRPPAFVPGSETRYSNAGYSIAALIAERATSKNWQELVTEYVCRPLQIVPSFGAPAFTDPSQPWGHSRTSGELTPVEPTATISAMQGAGGLSLSIRQYSVFLQMHLRGLRGEDTPLLHSSTIREMHRPDGRYGLGWGIQEYAGATSSVHAGGNGQFYALVAIQPERDRAVAFLTNDGGDDVESQASEILKTLLAGPPAK
jgi:CubicO group peptidase (beta-lactamase class C family)